MDKFEFLKKFRIFDIIVIVGIIAALIVGFFTFKHFRQTADKQIETTSPIVFDVYMRGITLTGNSSPIKPKTKTFISIRNVPYSDLEVLSVKSERRKIVLPMLANVKNNAPKKVLISEDYSQPYVYDIVVTLTDTAKITKDGAVVGGNKIKMGLPITLEGADYKFNGTVASITVTHEDMKDDITTNINKIDDVQ